MGMPLEQLRNYLGDQATDLGLNLDRYDPDRVPVHIAIIMDGNGRWAESRGLPRSRGHEAGIEGVRAAIRTCSDIGVRYLTIYSFSTENWNRPADEVDLLMNLFAHTMIAEICGLDEEDVRVKLIGDMEALPSETREAFEDAISRTRENKGMTLVLAVNYGARNEIVNAVKNIAQQAVEGNLDIDSIDEQFVSDSLYTSTIPDPDLLIRTSGEFRLSNFLLWQSAYSELYVTDVLWPDFDKFELMRAVLDYQLRDRRFGRVSA